MNAIVRAVGFIILSLRPRQWTKNLFVFAALLFSRNGLVPGQALKASAGVLLFCVASGAVYLFNDILDRERDRLHPEKSRRPIAAGNLGIVPAVIASVVLAAGALVFARMLDSGFFWCVAGFMVLQVAYSTILKNIVIIDVCALTAGFVVRVIAGAEVIGVEISRWLLLCATLIALFLAFGKRRHEITSMADDAKNHRRVLAEYSPYLLDQMIAVVAACTVIAYALYTMADETVRKFGTTNLIFTVPFVIYGIFRYLYLVHQRRGGGRPEMTLITDLPLLADALLWATAVGVILYR